MKKHFFCILIFSILLLSGCRTYDGPPKEPDTPEPAVHEGLFVSEHGTMEFFGDGESIRIDFDAELAGLTDLPEGGHEGIYGFLSGDLPPHGSIPIRYDMAHEMKITVGGETSVINMGIVADDGNSAEVGVNAVTPERIPMLFHVDGQYTEVLFQKEDSK